jgi:tetratricopeptide (TPR) repeat protein
MDLYKNTAIGLLFAFCLIPSLIQAAPPAPEEFRPTVDKVVEGFTNRDPGPFLQAIDYDRMLDVAFSGLLVERKRKQAFYRNFKSERAAQIVKQMFQRIPEGGYSKLLRIKMEGDIGHALVRMDFGEFGLGYMDIQLSRTNSGEIKIIDWFNYATGQLYTETLRQYIATISPTPTLLGKVYDITTNRKENADALLELMTMYIQGENEKAVRKFLTLDEELRKSRLLNVIAYQSTSVPDDMESYHKVLKNIERYFNTDESMSYLLLDYYYLEGDYEKAMKAVDRVQSTFGVEDAGILALKANVLVEMGKVEEAVAHARRAIEIEPEYEYSYLALLVAQVEQKQYGQAVSTADMLEKRFYYDFNPQVLSDYEDFAGFAESAEYRNWRNGK